MASSFAVSATLLLLKRQGYLDLSTHYSLLLTIAITTVCWVAAAFLAPQTDRRVLVAFYKKVRPFGPGWGPIRAAAGLPAQEAMRSHENIPLALLGWTAGCVAIWSSLFTVGTFLYGRWMQTGLLFAVFVVSGTVLLRVINRLWNHTSATEAIPTLEASSSAKRQLGV